MASTVFHFMSTGVMALVAGLCHRILMKNPVRDRVCLFQEMHVPSEHSDKMDPTDGL